MTHDPRVCLHDAISSCRLICQFTDGMNLAEYQEDLKTKSAVERQFEILGEALNRLKKLAPELLNEISDWQNIIAFRNVIAHAYDVIDDEVVFLVIKRQIPTLLKELEKRSDE
ncbi:MAG: DUF86 domain-containing protein [Candidatus Riflebacteria bacterium]|nr:DUF86 domain-containing protein [Candidatus Riflebacteria bacterium]